MLARRTVVVAGVPIGTARPALAQFAALAGLPNLSGAGQFRTLIDERENYSANGNVTQRLNSKPVLSMTAQVERSTGSGLSGLSSTLLRLHYNLAVFAVRPRRFASRLAWRTVATAPELDRDRPRRAAEWTDRPVQRYREWQVSPRVISPKPRKVF